MTEPRARRAPRKQRRALSNVGGPIELSGEDPKERAIVQHALEVQVDEQATLAHVHGFHSYPARLHPATAARLVEGLASARATVLDPFCGSGTTLVEARRLGRIAQGLDANPLAVALSELKSSTTTEAEREGWLAAGAAALEHAEDRRARKAGPTQRYAQNDRELFDVHVLLELDGLRDGINALGDPALRKVLKLVLSAILTKVSRRPGDTTEARVDRRLAGGYTLRLFMRKLEELCRRSAEYSKLVPRGTRASQVWLGDARALAPIKPRTADLIVCSPPYPGVYDYAAQHEDRLRWLGLDASTFREREIGARRDLHARDYESALRTWKTDLGRCLTSMRRVLVDEGRAVIVIADAVLAGRAVYAETFVGALAARSGLVLSTRGSQARPHFHLPTRKAFSQKPRAEHLLVLRKI